MNIRYKITLLVLLAAIVGCGDDKERETKIGLQEQVENRDDQIAKLQKDNEIVRSRSENDYKASETRHKEEITNLRELHRLEMVQLNDKVADLQLELGAVSKEKIVMEELIAQECAVKSGNEDRGRLYLLGMAVLNLAMLLIMLFGFVRYQQAVTARELMTMQQVGELRRIS